MPDFRGHEDISEAQHMLQLRLAHMKNSQASEPFDALCKHVFDSHVKMSVQGRRGLQIQGV
jgi:hypothetical protein